MSWIRPPVTAGAKVANEPVLAPTEVRNSPYVAAPSGPGFKGALKSISPNDTDTRPKDRFAVPIIGAALAADAAPKTRPAASSFAAIVVLFIPVLLAWNSVIQGGVCPGCVSTKAEGVPWRFEIFFYFKNQSLKFILTCSGVAVKFVAVIECKENRQPAQKL